MRKVLRGAHCYTHWALGVPKRLTDDEALAWHAPKGPLRPPYQYQWSRVSLRDQAPEQPSVTP